MLIYNALHANTQQNTNKFTKHTNSKTINKMKKLTKFFFVAAALFAGFSCTTDATEDLGAVVGGQTTLTISLEESRTQLGEKADGVYPLYWSVGDQISVNGVASGALTEGGNVSATFAFDGTLNHPYNVVYPASSANEVTFPAEQSYVPVTFASGAAPMYGYATENEAIQLRHLVGALRFDVLGSATLSSIVVEAANGSLSGTYTIDCATGVLTAKESTLANSVTLNFGEGLALSATATPIYVAVPAGNYGTVTVKLYSTENEVMIVTFDTTSKPVVVGMVREFNEISYKGESVGELGFEGDVVITTAEQLVQLSAAAEANKLANVTSVTIGATIDMSGVAWNSIKNLPAITFDGGSDKGYEIKGLSAPLFYFLSNVTLKNLKLADVDITVTEPYIHNGNAKVASCAIAYIAEGCTITNCYASGKILVNTKFNNAATPLDGNTNTVLDISGLFGYTGTTSMEKVTNAVDVTVKSLFDTSNGNTSVFYVLVGGVSGVLYDVNKANEIYNYGDITFDIEGDAQIATAMRCGGIFGYTPKVTSFTNVENHGDITVKGLNTTGGQYYGGLVGLPYSTPTFDTCKNSGAITVTSTAGSSSSFVIGSIGGTTNNNVALKNCIASNNSEGKGITLSISCAKLYTGMIGYIANSASTAYNHSIENCTNSTDLWLTPESSTTSSTYLTLGFSDTCGDSMTSIKITDFTATGDITINGSVAGHFYVGGIYGYMRAKNASAYKNTFTNCTYSGDITLNGAFSYRSTVGGIVGYNSSNYFTLDNCHMTGNITSHNTAEGDLTYYMAIGGISGYNGQEIEYKTLCTNSGDISISGNCKGAHPLLVGGISGWTAHNNANRYNAFNVINSGNITIGKENVTTAINNLNVGGVVGKFTNSAACTGCENAVNTGNITIAGKIEGVTDASYIGGIIGYSEEPIVNATAYCSISALGFTNVGWITGTPRVAESVTAKNCKIGGSVIEVEVDIEDESKTEKVTPITEENYYNYIFGGETDWTGVDNYDGCTFLSANPLQ